MAQSTYKIDDFRGLDLVNEPDEVPATQAIDLLNVDLDKRGSVRTRDGFSTFATLTGYSNINELYPVDIGGTHQLLASAIFDATSTTRVAAVSTSGSILATLDSGGQENRFVRWGSASAARIYFTNGVLRTSYWDGSAFTTSANGPAGAAIGVMTSDNRLVAANIANAVKPTGSTATGSTSLVHFSDAGAPDTWPATNWLLLTPGDNEDITTIATWRNLTFVFKPSRYFVFYGNSVDTSGNPVFNYRTIDTGVGALVNSGVAVTENGVVFLHSSGVYLTDGGVPRRLSTDIDRLVTGTASSFYVGPTRRLSTTQLTRMAYVGRRLYVTFRDAVGLSSSILVYDFDLDAWTVYQVSGSAPYSAAGWDHDQDSVSSFLYGERTGSRILRADPTATSDSGSAIASRYRSGFYAPLEDGAQESTLRESIIDGTGTPTFSVSRDFGAVPSVGGGAAASVTLGTAPAVAQGRHRRAQRGRRFSYQIEATSGAWKVNAVTQVIDSPRRAGLKTS